MSWRCVSSFQGRRLPPGAETLPGRVQDLQAVVAAAHPVDCPNWGSGWC